MMSEAYVALIPSTFQTVLGFVHFSGRVYGDGDNSSGLSVIVGCGFLDV